MFLVTYTLKLLYCHCVWFCTRGTEGLEREQGEKVELSESMCSRESYTLKSTTKLKICLSLGFYKEIMSKMLQWEKFTTGHVPL